FVVWIFEIDCSNLMRCTGSKRWCEEEAYNEKQAEREARKREQATKKQKETTAELIDDEEEVHTLQLPAKRIELNRREFDLLDWSLNDS
ncbi:hypothetical protein PC119_g27871, partial [Phytophthora cactorum]